MNNSDDVLFSIIVPVYNVKNYIHKCVDSILGQTYSSFECILIDDGSTDSSGRIIDEYANKDSRVITFHKKNGGVSSARNVGLKEAKGKWILFIDGDDYIEEYALERINQEIRDDVDLIMFEHQIDYPSGKAVKHYVDEKGYYGLIDRSSCIGSVIQHEGAAFPFGKLFRAEIAKNKRFREEFHWGEDAVYVIETEELIEHAVRIPDVLYHYVQSDNSAARGEISERKMTVLDTSEWILEFFRKKYPEYIGAALDIYVNTRVNLYYRLYIGKNKKYLNRLSREMKQAYDELKTKKKITLRWKMKYCLFYLNPRLYCIVLKWLVRLLPGEKYNMYKV